MLLFGHLATCSMPLQLCPVSVSFCCDLLSVFPGGADRRLDLSVLGDGGQPAQRLLRQQPHQPVSVHHEVLKYKLVLLILH